MQKKNFLFKAGEFSAVLAAILFTLTPFSQAVARTTGSITICVSALTPTNSAITAAAPNSFSITLKNSNGAVIQAPTFNAPLNINKDVLKDISSSSNNDSECRTFSSLPMDTYTYTAETISPNNTGWDAPTYNDEAGIWAPTAPVTDAYPYQDDIYMHGQSDGKIIVSNQQGQTLNRRLLVINHQKTAAPLTQCDDGIDNNNNGLVDANDPACHTDGVATNSASYSPSIADEAQQCNVNASQTIVSDTSAQVDGHNAALLSYIAPSWPSITGASWIWSHDPVEDPVNETVKTFTKTFNIIGAPTSASLQIAGDNDYDVVVNGHEICSKSTTIGSIPLDSCTIPATDLSTGTNIISFTVLNEQAGSGTLATINPAGLLYKLTVNNNECGSATTAASTVKVHIYKYVQDLYGRMTLLSGSIPFPTFAMTATGADAGSYNLGDSHNSAPYRYQADSAAMPNGSSYATQEVTDSTLVLPNSTPVNDPSCTPGDYHLLGYKVGDTRADAEHATLSTTAPSFTSLTKDQSVIVENEKCASQPNQPPTVNAGPDQTINSTSVTLSGTATDPDGTITRTEWDAETGGTITSPGSLTTTVTGLQHGVTYDFQLWGFDDQGRGGFDDVLVTVN